MKENRKSKKKNNIESVETLKKILDMQKKQIII